MSEQSGLPVVSLESISDSTELSLDENLLVETPKSEMVNESEGSIGSHLLFGLGTLVFSLPMLFPGIPMTWLVVFYGGLFVAGIVGYLLWRALSTLKTLMKRLGRRKLRRVNDPRPLYVP